MTPLPPPLGSGEIVVWRLDHQRHAGMWDSGEGAFRVGGRWNPKGMRAVYCALDPATAILEVAVHKGFPVLDTVPHVLTAAAITAPARVHVVTPDDVPNPNWLRPGTPSIGQQAFGAELLERHALILIPSAVSTHSWNLIFDPQRARGLYAQSLQERFALDPRLHAPPG